MVDWCTRRYLFLQTQIPVIIQYKNDLQEALNVLKSTMQSYLRDLLMWLLHFLLLKMRIHSALMK